MATLANFCRWVLFVVLAMMMFKLDTSSSTSPDLHLAYPLGTVKNTMLITLWVLIGVRRCRGCFCACA
ncbi:hypothetical protein ACVXHB_18200 [Escherichia coli]